MARRRWRPPSWPPTGTQPASWSVPCRPRSRPAWPPNPPHASPRVLREPLRHYERALELWARVPQAAEVSPLDRITLLERAAEAAHLLDEYPRAVELVGEALASVDLAADSARAGLLHERLGRYLWMSLDEAALSAHQEAVRLVPAAPPSGERGRVLAGHGRVCHPQGRGA